MLDLGECQSQDAAVPAQNVSDLRPQERITYITINCNALNSTFYINQFNYLQR